MNFRYRALCKLEDFAVKWNHLVQAAARLGFYRFASIPQICVNLKTGNTTREAHTGSAFCCARYIWYVVLFLSSSWRGGLTSRDTVGRTAVEYASCTTLEHACPGIVKNHRLKWLPRSSEMLTYSHGTHLGPLPWPNITVDPAAVSRGGTLAIFWGTT